jgi:hypothetical protein
VSHGYRQAILVRIFPLRVVARCVLVGVLACLWALPAAAQQRAIAEKLFGEAAELMDAGDFEGACPKLEESQRLDPAGGTVFLLGHCYEGMGKTASAWQQFKSAISWARRDNRPEREEMAAQRVKVLEPQLSRLAVDVAPEVAQIKGLKIEIDGAELGKGLWGTQLPADPGPHVIAASAPSYQRAEQTVDLGDKADLKLVTIPMLRPSDDAVSMDEGGAGEAEPADRGEAADDGQGQRVLSYVIGGVGVLSLGVGTVFGLQALSKRSEAEERCPESPCADPVGVDANDDAKVFANVSNIGIGVGVVALGVATYLFLTAPSAPPQTALRARRAVDVDPILGPNGGGMVLRGAF